MFPLSEPFIVNLSFCLTITVHTKLYCFNLHSQIAELSAWIITHILNPWPWASVPSTSSATTFGASGLAQVSYQSVLCLFYHMILTLFSATNLHDPTQLSVGCLQHAVWVMMIIYGSCLTQPTYMRDALLFIESLMTTRTAGLICVTLTLLLASNKGNTYVASLCLCHVFQPWVVYMDIINPSSVTC